MFNGPVICRNCMIWHKYEYCVTEITTLLYVQNFMKTTTTLKCATVYVKGGAEHVNIYFNAPLKRVRPVVISVRALILSI